MSVRKFVKVAADTFTLPLPGYANMLQVHPPKVVLKPAAPSGKPAGKAAAK